MLKIHPQLKIDKVRPERQNCQLEKVNHTRTHLGYFTYGVLTCEFVHHSEILHKGNRLKHLWGNPATAVIVTTN